MGDLGSLKKDHRWCVSREEVKVDVRNEERKNWQNLKHHWVHPFDCQATVIRKNPSDSLHNNWIIWVLAWHDKEDIRKCTWIGLNQMDGTKEVSEVIRTHISHVRKTWKRCISCRGIFVSKWFWAWHCNMRTTAMRTTTTTEQEMHVYGEGEQCRQCIKMALDFFPPLLTPPRRKCHKGAPSIVSCKLIAKRIHFLRWQQHVTSSSLFYLFYNVSKIECGIRKNKFCVGESHM